MLTSRYDEAFRYAHDLHRDQTRKGTLIIGIDYSDAETPTASLKGPRAYLAEGAAPPVRPNRGSA
jgi:hypothetical protein